MLDFIKKFDDKHMSIDEAWDMCCDSYFNLIKLKRENDLLAETKVYFEHVCNEHKLSLLGAMIAFSEIYYFENIRKLFEQHKRNNEIDVQQADDFLLIKLHANQFRNDCKNIQVIDKEFEHMHKVTERMIKEMNYLANAANITLLMSKL